jgi:hypothetical protein
MDVDFDFERRIRLQEDVLGGLTYALAGSGFFRFTSSSQRVTSTMVNWWRFCGVEGAVMAVFHLAPSKQATVRESSGFCQVFNHSH